MCYYLTGRSKNTELENAQNLEIAHQLSRQVNAKLCSEPFLSFNFALAIAIIQS